MGTRRLIYLGLLVSSCWYFFTQRHWLSWTVLLWVLAVPLLSLLLSLPAMLQIKLNFTCPERATQDAPVRPMLQVRCRYPMPMLRCRIQVRHVMTGDSYLYELGEVLQTQHCGVRKLRIWRLWVYDYLGLFRRRVRGLPDYTLIVTPNPLAPHTPPRLHRGLTGRFRPKNGGYAEHHEMRPYQPGDSLRLIHWKLSAKTDALLVRQPMTPQQDTMVLSMVLSGDEATLDRKLGQLLWAGEFLLEQHCPHQIRCLTDNGLLQLKVTNSQELTKALDTILASPAAQPNTPMPPQTDIGWLHHIGGDDHEA